MNFTHPGLLAAGAACVAIPILIHLLLRRRRKPVLWGAMRFIIEAHRRTRRRLRLERWLLLAMRCLFLLLLGAALARPLLDASAAALGAPGSRTVYILIDNALAADAREPGAPEDQAALARHKESAARLLDTLTPADRAALIALGSPAMALVSPPSADRAAVRTLLDNLQPTDGAADFAGALDIVARDLANATPAQTGSPSVVVLSDFLLGSADLVRPLPRVEPPSGVAAPRLLASRPAEMAPGNVQILAVDPLRPVSLTGADAPLAGEQVRIQLRRTGPATGEASTTTIRLSVMGANTGTPIAAGSTTVRWSPGQTDAVATATIDPASAGALGEYAAIIAEIDADAIGPDNIFRRPVGVRESLRVAIVDRRRFGETSRVDRMSPGEWMRLALRPNDASPIDVTDLPPAAIDAAALAAVDVVYIPRPDLVDEPAWARLRAFAFGGGLVIVTPPPEANIHLWADMMTEALGLDWRLARESAEVVPPQRLSEDQPSNLFTLLGSEWADLSRTVEISRILAVEESGPATRTLLALQNGSPWMLSARPGGSTSEGDTEAIGSGLVVYLASAPTLSWTSLPAKPLMLPLMQELVRQGAGQAVTALAHVAGGRLLAPPRAAELVPLSETRRQIGGADRAAILVDSAGRAAEPVRHAGLYRAVDERGATRGLVAVNADAAAGRTETQTGASVQQWLAQALPQADGAATVDASRVQWIDDASLARALESNEEGSPFSLPLLIGAACVLLLETLLARLFAHAKAESEAPAGRSVAEALEAAA